MNYFEHIYLGKQEDKDLLKGNKRLQKLLTVSALTSSIDSKRISTKDLKQMKKRMNPSTGIVEFDIEGYINPYGFL